MQTLYKTQVRELKEECEERNKLYKDAQQSMQDLQEERWFGCLKISSIDFYSALNIDENVAVFFPVTVSKLRQNKEVVSSFTSLYNLCD